MKQSTTFLSLPTPQCSHISLTHLQRLSHQNIYCCVNYMPAANEGVGLLLLIGSMVCGATTIRKQGPDTHFMLLLFMHAGTISHRVLIGCLRCRCVPGLCGAALIDRHMLNQSCIVTGQNGTVFWPLIVTCTWEGIIIGQLPSASSTIDISAAKH